MCLPGLCPGDNFERLGEHLDKQIAGVFAQGADKSSAPVVTPSK